MNRLTERLNGDKVAVWYRGYLISPLELLKEVKRFCPVLEALEELASYEDAMEKVNEILKVQGTDGNWDYDEYMRGLYNGMEIVISIIEGREPKFRNKKAK